MLVNITEEQKEILGPLIPDLDDLLMKATDEELLLALDDLIVDELDDQQQNLSERGVQLQKLYDQIFSAND